MAHVAPVSEEAAESLWHEHYGRVTNLKRTLARDPLTLHAYMEWYPMRDRVAAFLGERATNVFVHAISSATDCLICSTFFRRLLIEAGEDPDHLELGPREELVVELGRQLVEDANGVSADLTRRLAMVFSDEEIVLLVAFGGLMIATNVVANALRIDLDDYLTPYRKPAP